MSLAVFLIPCQRINLVASAVLVTAAQFSATRRIFPLHLRWKTEQPAGYCRQLADEPLAVFPAYVLHGMLLALEPRRVIAHHHFPLGLRHLEAAYIERLDLNHVARLLALESVAALLGSGSHDIRSALNAHHILEKILQNLLARAVTHMRLWRFLLAESKGTHGSTSRYHGGNNDKSPDFARVMFRHNFQINIRQQPFFADINLRLGIKSSS